MWRFLLIGMLLICTSYVFAQRELPHAPYYTRAAYGQILNDSTQTYSHLSLKPISDNQLNTDLIYLDEGQFYYWITQKLFKEHFLIFEGEDYWCAVDPIVDVELGRDFSSDSTNLLYWNTRGIRVQAKFFNKVAFNSVVYETQAFVPVYMERYFYQHGEFFPNPQATIYNQVNAVIPGYARAKLFKTNGFDFGMAEGQLTWRPSTFFNVQIGNGKKFIGDGYRSMLWSDYSLNFPFIQWQTNLFNNRIQYTFLQTVHQNLYRLPLKTTPEATYERKLATFHYLDFAITKNWKLGVFEANQFMRTDSSGTLPMNYLILNPVIGASSALANDDNYASSLVGINTSFSLPYHLFYGQFSMFNGGFSGWQVGMRQADFIPNLDLLLEFNTALPNAYLSDYNRMNFSNSNLPIAHPLVGGFKELIFQIDYEWEHLFISNSTVFSERLAIDSIQVGNNILGNKTDGSEISVPTKNVFYNRLEIGYRFNHKYNLQVFAGYLFRDEFGPNALSETNYVFFGIRTRLQNKYLDF